MLVDGLGWGSACLYYWGGADACSWPGNAMTKCDFTFEGHDVYTAAVPADVTGFLFSDGDNRTTNDITTGIADGAAWMQTSGGTVSVVLSDPSSPPSTDGYYLAFTTELATIISKAPCRLGRSFPTIGFPTTAPAYIPSATF